MTGRAAGAGRTVRRLCEMNTETTEKGSPWHSLPVEEVAQRRGRSREGLSAAEAEQRLQQYGPNRLAAKKKESGLQAFLRQYQDFMQIILLAAAAVSFFFTGQVGTTVLVALTILNAVLGLRGAKAEASLSALEKMLKNIAGCAGTARRSRSTPRGSSRATWC